MPGETPRICGIAPQRHRLLVLRYDGNDVENVAIGHGRGHACCIETHFHRLAPAVFSIALE